MGLGWVLLVAAASALYRVRRGRYIFRPQFPNAVFSETWASGRSHRSLLTRLGGANRCLWVAVTPDELLVGPHFPFNLFFMPGGGVFRTDIRLVKWPDANRKYASAGNRA